MSQMTERIVRVLNVFRQGNVTDDDLETIVICGL